MGNNKTLAEKLYEWMLRFEGKKENKFYYNRNTIGNIEVMLANDHSTFTDMIKNALTSVKNCSKNCNNHLFEGQNVEYHNLTLQCKKCRKLKNLPAYQK